MENSIGSSVRVIGRGVFAVMLAYLLVIQALTGSLRASNPMDLAQAGLGVICTSSDSHPTPADPAGSNCPDMPCCVLGGRVQIDVAIAPPLNDLVIPEPLLVQRLVYSYGQSSVFASYVELTPLQPRAPPSYLV